MAAQAVRSLDPVIVIDVAVRAWSGCVRANQREASDAVIEGSAVPSLGSVAVRAIGRGEIGTRCGVNRRSSLLPLGQMASGVTAVRGSDLQIVIVVDVAS